MELGKWSDIANEFKDTLVLSNGASIAVDTRFDYQSLLEEAKEANLINNSVDEVFNYLGTKDFEFVLWTLGFVSDINQKLKVETQSAKEAYQKVQNALIETIHKVHPQRNEIEQLLKPIYSFMKNFQTVVSLNYDLIVYWSILEAKRELGNHFKDCFVNGRFTENWQRLREPHKADASTLVFYPHGNLCLVTDPKEGDYKIIRQDENTILLDAIVNVWRQNSKIPLFVSEGDSKQKLTAIRRSGYLSTVFNSVIPSLSGSLAIYGWSLDYNDEHILKQLCQHTKTIAISVHRNRLAGETLEQHCTKNEKKIKRINPNIQVLFYDAESPGCWINSTQPLTTSSCRIP